MQTDVMHTVRWMRVFGDTIFAAGALSLAIFIVGLPTGGATGAERFHVAEPVQAEGE